MVRPTPSFDFLGEGVGPVGLLAGNDEKIGHIQGRIFYYHEHQSFGCHGTCPPR
jgi:hypothetical protein